MNTEDEDTTPAGDEDTTEQPDPAGDEDTTEQPDPAEGDDDEGELEDGDSFPRAYVQKIRDRAAGYRTRAKSAEDRAAELERALFTERVRALDVLADPEDLPFSAELLDDHDALVDAVDTLVAKRPHYRRRGTTDPAGTGSRERGRGHDSVSLSAIMRGNA